MDAELRNRNELRKMVEEGWFAPENREKILAGIKRMRELHEAEKPGKSDEETTD